VRGRSSSPSGRLVVRARRRRVFPFAAAAADEFSRDHAQRFSGGRRRRSVHVGRTSAVGRRRG